MLVWLKIEMVAMNRRRLKTIASNIAGNFISRNNDVDGYWALGLLYETASKSPDNKITIDILSGHSVPDYQYSDYISCKYRDIFFKQAKNNHIDLKHTCEFKIELTFNVNPTAKQVMFRATWGEPFICKVIFVDDLNNERSYAIRSWCGIHNPNREHRSIRRLPR